jgi:hypothetical protein
MGDLDVYIIPQSVHFYFAPLACNSRFFLTKKVAKFSPGYLTHFDRKLFEINYHIKSKL